ncbi:ATP-binding protein [Streptomyces sp. NPDC046759]|uniref:ATP-binding protein n=1 Tax=Streptomyces sp. NPDC046759 TaxID=3155019 RepID=UPI0033C3CA33
MHLTVGEHSVGHIRRIVRSLLDEWALTELTFSVELGVSELVTNVVRHVPDRRCTVLLARLTTGVRAEVTDGLPQLPLPRMEVVQEEESGRGLALLDAVVDKWGVTSAAGGGKTVWFECRTCRSVTL